MTYLRIAVYYYSRMLRKNVDIHHNSPRILIVHYLRIYNWLLLNSLQVISRKYGRSL